MPPKHAGQHAGHGGGHVPEIRQHLEALRSQGLLSDAQFQSITAQLPHQGQASTYTDPRYSGQKIDPSAISHAAQDPQHPAHPSHPEHHQWASSLGSKLGNAAVWGAGASAGSAAFHALV